MVGRVWQATAGYCNRRTPVLTKMGGYRGDEKMPFRKKKQDIFLATAAFVLHIQFLQYPILLHLLALQPAVGFGLSNNTSPFVPIYHQLSPSSHAQHLKISFHFFSPSFPGSSSSSCPFQFLSEDLFPIPNTVYKNIAQLESNSIPGTGRLSPPHHVQTRSGTHHVQTRSGTHPVSYPKYPWLLSQQQILCSSNNLWILYINPAQKHFTFYSRTQYDWINNRSHKAYKNTTHQNVILHYLELIFLNSAAVIPSTLLLTFRCLRHFQLPWWHKINILITFIATVHVSYLLTNCWKFN